MIHPKTLLISRHFYSLEPYVWRLIYNLKIDTISTYDISLDRSFLKLWNGIRHVMPSTGRRLELKEKTSMAQNAWQAFVYASGLTVCKLIVRGCRWGKWHKETVKLANSKIRTQLSVANVMIEGVNKTGIVRNVTLGHVRATVVAVGQQRALHSLCVWSLRYAACNTHAPYFRLWPALLCNIF